MPFKHFRIEPATNAQTHESAHYTEILEDNNIQPTSQGTCT